MIHEHEATRLASAAMDFTLDPDEERELRLELGECPVCAERASAYRAQLRMITRLPKVDASEATRRRVTAAAMGRPVESMSRLFLLAAAAMLLGLALAGAAAAGFFRTDRTPPELGNVDVSPTVAANGSEPPSQGPGGPSPDSTRATGPVDADIIATDTVAEVVTTNLRVRSEPRVADDSILLEPFLQPGDRVYVADGPVHASDYDWYRVAPIGRDPRQMWEGLPLGWVARADHDGTPWIASTSPDCPTEPVEIDDVVGLHALERIICFGQRSLSFLAIVDGDSTSGWFASGGVTSDPRDVPPGVTLAPALARVADLKLPDGSGQPYRSAMVVEGSFDRADLSGCSVDPDDASRELMALLQCRSQFVLDRVTRKQSSLMAGLPAVTVTGNLRVRSLPFVGAESARLNLLDEGTQLFLLDGPAIGSGYVWFRAVAPSILDGVRPLAGWVAIEGQDGEPWVGQAGVDCPSPDVLTVGEFVALTGPEVVHGGMVCFGQQLVRVDAHARIECTQTPWNNDTNWILDPGRTMFVGDGDVEVPVVRTFNPDELSCGQALSASTYRIGGHFDDPSSLTCSDGGQSPEPRASEVVVYECRTRFIVTELFAVDS